MTMAVTLKSIPIPHNPPIAAVRKYGQALNGAKSSVCRP